MDTKGNGHWQLPRLSESGRVFAGVARGIADEIGTDALIVRLSFVVLTVAGGWGAIIYGMAWGIMAWGGKSRSSEPFVARPKGRNERDRTIAVGAVVAGLLLLVKDLGFEFEDAIVWPLVMLTAGLLLAWRRVVPEHHSEVTGRPWQIAVGAVLMLASIVWVVQLNFDIRAAASAVIALGLLTVSALLLFGPLGYRLWSNLIEERRLRIRSEEKAEMAAHLHDSVLQTLTLMQQSVEDPLQVAALARRQERELREWLYGDRFNDGSRHLREELNLAAAEVEQAHNVTVEVVVVGDIIMSRRIEALLGASREAMTNAARHSGSERVDVFAEVASDQIEVFIRDTGCGFNLDAVASDRKGVTESLIGRMERAGGSALIETSVGNGTEVHLILPLNSDEESS